ncbi:MAG TPA: hypothetical protein VI029_20445 [Mycobacterium sp.]
MSEPCFPEVQSTPGPDGTRILAGAVEFAAAVDLIGKIKPELPG